MDSVNFIVYIKTNDIYEDFAEDVEKSFGTSSYEFNRPLLKEQENYHSVMKDELAEKIMKKFVRSLHKKRSFPLRISSVNVAKSAVFCRFGPIYRSKP